MTLDQWPRVKELFHAALDHPPANRAGFLADACKGEEALRTEVERLLAAHAQAGSFIEAPPVAAIVTLASSLGTMTGRRIGHYEVGALVGAGGMGTVYAAQDLELQRSVALKVVTGGDLDAQVRLRREAQHASQLNHPHICTIHEVGAVDGKAYIVMEFVEGRPLGELVGPDGLPIETTLRHGIQISDALAHAHNRGVIHRDLKSANVVVTPEGRAKVLDFGLARVIPTDRAKELSQSRAPLAEESHRAGTLSYMAPELLRGEQAGTQTDIWALGVMLYEMAAGRRPFGGGTPFEVSAAILDAPPAPLPTRLPAALSAIIQRCLAKDPHERFGRAVEVRTALEAVQADIATRARPSSVLSTTRFVRSRAFAAALVGLTAAIVVASTLTWRWTRPADTPVAVGASGRPAIAVMSFDNMIDTKESSWLSKGVPSMLLTGLAQIRGLDIVGTQRLHEALKQHGQDNLESLDKGAMADVARRAGAGAIVVGSIAKAGPELRIDAQLEDLSTGRVLLAESVRGTDLFALVDQLTSRIRDGVGVRTAANVRSVAEVSSQSLEAYRLYSEGMEARLNTRWQDAQRQLEGAVTVDPTFAEAYMQLGIVSGPLGRPAAQREHFRKAAELANRLNERSRLLLQALLARGDNNFAETARVLDELIARFPDVVDAYTVGFRLYVPVNGPLQNLEKLLDITETGVRALPTSTVTRNNRGYALLYAGRYSEAIREFEAYARIAPREPNPFDSLGDAYLWMGLPEKAIDSYSRALTIDPSYSPNGRAWSLAVLGRLDQALLDEPTIPHLKAVILARAGRYREAEQAITVGARDAKAAANFARGGGLALVSSELAIERKEYARALQDIRSAERLYASLPEETTRPHLVLADLLSGIAEIRRGNTNAALSHLESQRRIYEPTVEAEKWWHHALEGEIALARGDARKAALAFSAGQPSRRVFTLNSVADGVLFNNLGFRDGLARAAKARGDLTGAIEIYRDLLTYGPEQKWVAAFEPRYVLEIARLLHQAGNKGAARQEYQRFLGLWKGADPGLPELAEARRAILALR
jgi:serine/threonine protein kinase/tetratricopeptide (TPR) repeat protein